MPSDPKNRPRVPTGSDDFEDEATQVGDFGLRHATAPSAKHDRPYLIVISGETLGRMYRIDQVETVLGRGAEAGVRLTDDGISRKHAVLVRRGDQLWLEDLKSANGTRVNGESIQGRVVKDGDQIQVGNATILKLTYSDELEEAFQKNMYDAALRDGLTKAFNKHHFLERLPSEVAYARRHGTPLSLTMLDVDLFKAVNDEHGHVAGDQVLVVLAQVVTACVAAEDFFARYGGEEFALLSRRDAAGDGARLAEEIRARIAGTNIAPQGVHIPVTVSLGVASFRADAHASASDLVADADSALYEAKRGGRNRVVVHARP